MIKYILAALLILPSVVFANTAILQWDASPSPEVEGYVVYYGADPLNFNYIKPVGNVLTTEIAQLPAGEWHFTVTAFSSDAESEQSNVVSAVYEAYAPPLPVAHEPIVIPTGTGATLTISISVE